MIKHLIRIGLTFLVCIIMAIMYMLVLMRLFDSIAIERYYLSTWGFAPFVLLLSLAGLLLSIKSTHVTSLICSIGIPALIVIGIFIFLVSYPNAVRIPLFNQYREYHESIRYAALSILVFPISSLSVFTLIYAACSYRQKKSDGHEAA